jgi:Uma2 family endonuclease
MSFVSWSRPPKREVPDDPIAGLAPDLAVEVLSKGYTKKEMQRKLREYFLAGVQLVWFVDPARRVVQVYTAPDQCLTLTEDQTLEGGEVLPGLALPLKKVVARTPQARRGKARRASRTTRKNGGRQR